VRSRVVSHQSEGDEHRLARNFRLAEGGNPLAKNPNHGEAQFADANFLADRVLVWKHARSQLLSQQADLGVRYHVVGIEITTAKHHQSANLLEALGHPYEFYRPLDTGSNYGHGNIRRSRSHRNLRDL